MGLGRHRLQGRTGPSILRICASVGPVADPPALRPEPPPATAQYRFGPARIGPRSEPRVARKVRKKLGEILLQEGVVTEEVLTECQGIDFKTNFGLGLAQRFWLEIGAAYPLKYHQVRSFHTGTFMTLLSSMLRQFLPAHLKSKMIMGCVSEAGRLDGVYATPNLPAAQERFLRRMTSALQERYANEEAFSLGD